MSPKLKERARAGQQYRFHFNTIYNTRSDPKAVFVCDKYKYNENDITQPHHPTTLLIIHSTKAMQNAMLLLFPLFNQTINIPPLPCYPLLCFLPLGWVPLPTTPTITQIKYHNDQNPSITIPWKRFSCFLLPAQLYGKRSLFNLSEDLALEIYLKI